MEVAKIINKLTKYMEKIQLMLGVVFLTVFFVTILIQIFARYFGIPVIWTEEVSNYSFIWSAVSYTHLDVYKRQLTILLTLMCLKR